jgi:thymidylate synthase (FAD)
MKNKVEIIGFYGSDLTHAQSAWTSTSRDLTEEKINRIPSLLKMLADNGHETPFEKSSFNFLVTVDQASHIHLLKHRIGVSINGECLTGDSLITFINSGRGLDKITISDLYDKWTNGRPHQNTDKDKEYVKKRLSNKKLRVLNEDTGVFEIGHVKNVMMSGLKEVYKITTESGNVIKCSANHKILTIDGWKTLNDGLTTKDFLALNGIKVAGNGGYRDKNLLKACRDVKMSVQEMANKFECSYHTIRKWLKIHDLKHSKEETCFKKGCLPWNKGKKGYKLSFSEDGFKRKKEASNNQPKGKDSKFWRGGITKERALIGQFTRKVAPEIHRKYNYTCQECGLGGKLHCHHIIPVVTDISKAYDINNLITVCDKCHHKIHNSSEAELLFAEKVTGLDFKDKIKDFGTMTKNRKSTKLRVHYSKIISIEKIGEEMCYDLEVDHKYHNFVANGVIVHNSARYKELKEDKFYLPEDWWDIKVTPDVKYDLNYPQEEYMDWFHALELYTQLGNKLYHKSLEQLTPVIGRKRAKESSRYFKTMNSQITMDIMFNWRSFVHFYKLRSDEAAQLEIREISEEMLKLIKNIDGNPFKHTIEAFNL